MWGWAPVLAIKACGQGVTAASVYSTRRPCTAASAVLANFYVTHDAGEHWQTLTPRPAVGPVQQLDATSATSKWVLAEVPTCATPGPQRPCKTEELLHTTDGGQTWPAVKVPIES